MTETIISDAAVFPQDEGTGVPDGSEDYTSAAYFGMLARQADGEYVDNGLGFANIDTANELVDVTAGHAYIEADQNTISVQSGSQTLYDTDLPVGSTIAYLVVLPTDTTGLSLATDAVNDVYLYVDPTANDSVTLRYGSAVADPETDATPKPSLKLGTVDSTSGATTRPNDGQVLGGGAGGSVDFDGNAIRNLSSVSTESLNNTQPAGTYDWQTVQWIREQGGVVASNGKVYQGASALQDAINAVGESGTVLAGAATYDPITIDKRNMLVYGLGRNTAIASQSADTPAVTINDDGANNQSVYRVQLTDLLLTTTNATGASDCLNIEVLNGNNIYECWFTNIQMQGGPRHGVNMTGTAAGDVVGMWFSQLFGEGFSDTAFVGNQYTQEVNIMGANLDQNSTNYVVDIDGDRYQILAHTLRDQGTSSAIRFGANSLNSMVITPDDVTSIPVDNGSNNQWITRDSKKLGGDFLKRQETYGPQTPASLAAFVGKGGNTYVDGGTAGHAFDLTDPYRISISDCRVETTSGAGNNYDGVFATSTGASYFGNKIRNVWFEQSDRNGVRIENGVDYSVIADCYFDTASIDNADVFIDSTGVVVKGCVFDGGGSITLGANSASCVVVGNTDVTVTNNGAASNVVANNS